MIVVFFLKSPSKLQHSYCCSIYNKHTDQTNQLAPKMEADEFEFFFIFITLKILLLLFTSTSIIYVNINVYFE